MAKKKSKQIPKLHSTKKPVKGSKRLKKAAAKKLAKKRYMRQGPEQISLKASSLFSHERIKEPEFQKQIAGELAKIWKDMPVEEKREWFKYSFFSAEIRNVASLAAKQLSGEASKKYDASKFKQAGELFAVAQDQAGADEMMKTQREMLVRSMPAPLEEKPASAAEWLRKKLSRSVVAGWGRKSEKELKKIEEEAK